MAAVASEQVSWAWVCVHMQTIMRVSIEESAVIAVVYDEMQRKSWARRSSKGDSTLNLLEEASKKSTQVLELAKSRVKLVSETAGLKSAASVTAQASHEPRWSSTASANSDAEAAISKQVAAAQQIKRQAEQAVAALDKQKTKMHEQPNKWKQQGNHNDRNGKGKVDGGKGFWQRVKARGGK